MSSFIPPTTTGHSAGKCLKNLAMFVLCGIPYVQFPQRWKGNQPIRLNSHAQLFLYFPHTTLCSLIVMTTVAVMTALAPQKSCLLSCEVDTECDGRDAEAGE
jgi:hypothetical protein